MCIRDRAELTRQANRANTTIYTIDPRGLVAGADIDQTGLDSADWQDHVRETQSSLRVIAESTGGLAAINTNASKKRRAIEIRVKPSEKRRGERYQLDYKTSYTLKPPAAGR